MSLWNAIFGSTTDGVLLTVAGIDEYLRRQVPRGIQELKLESVEGCVRIVSVVLDNWHCIENRTVRNHQELEEIALLMVTLNDLPLSDRAPPPKRPQKPPREIVFVDQYCPECAVSIAESVDNYRWVLPAGKVLNCELCGASLPAHTQDVEIQVVQSTSARLTTRPLGTSTKS